MRIRGTQINGGISAHLIQVNQVIRHSSRTFVASFKHNKRSGGGKGLMHVCSALPTFIERILV